METYKQHYNKICQIYEDMRRCQNLEEARAKVEKIMEHIYAMYQEMEENA